VISPRLRNVIVGTVTVVWAANFTAGLIPALKYTTDPTIHAVFMAIVGGAIALGAKGKNNDGDGDSGTAGRKQGRGDDG
jgi:fucose permease